MLIFNWENYNIVFNKLKKHLNNSSKIMQRWKKNGKSITCIILKEANVIWNKFFLFQNYYIRFGIFYANMLFFLSGRIHIYGYVPFKSHTADTKIN